jgi:hypothetical protein
MNYLPGLALNCDPPDLCLLGSYDYRREPPPPSYARALMLFCLSDLSLLEQVLLK